MLVDSTDKDTKLSLPSMLFCCTRQIPISSVAEYFCFTKCDAEIYYFVHDVHQIFTICTYVKTANSYNDLNSKDNFTKNFHFFISFKNLVKKFVMELVI
jgi:hypothetical protein